MSPFDALTEKALTTLSGVALGPTGKKTAHAFADLPDGRAVSCTACQQPARFGTVRTSFAYKVDGKTVSRELAQSLLDAGLPTSIEEQQYAAFISMTCEQAKRVAGEQAGTALAKTMAKVGTLKGADMSLSENAIELNGTREGRSIRVLLQAVSKTSGKGKQFMQWPARIYINGEYTPEHIYKRLFA